MTLAAGWARAQATPQPTKATTHMAADAHASFAVAAIKLHNPDSPGGGFDAEGQRFTILGESVAKMMSFAYSIHADQIVGAPGSALRDRYDIVGIADGEGEPNLRQQQEMIQKLLAERFSLRFHREQRELPVYAIELVKGGPKLKETIDAGARPDWAIDFRGTVRRYAYTNASIAVFMLGEQTILNRPLVDRTGLTGHYDFYLSYNSDETNTTDPNAPPGLLTAVQEQLGLRFRPTKALIEVFVIDHVERPSEN